MKKLLVGLIIVVGAYLPLCFADGVEGKTIVPLGEYGKDPVIFKIESKDINKVYVDKNSLTITLAPPATKRFEEVTSKNHGKLMRLYYDGLEVVHAQILFTSSNGKIYVSDPSAAVKAKLAPYINGSH